MFSGADVRMGAAAGNRCQAALVEEAGGCGGVTPITVTVLAAGVRRTVLYSCCVRPVSLVLY